jgi:hypothetical protein
MKDAVEGVEQGDSSELESQSRHGEDIVASRGVATDRVFKGGLLAVLGFGGALLMDVLKLSPGVPFWISLGVALTAFGSGAIWAGFGATHLMRHGRRGSPLWLISLAGLGGSVILNVVSGLLIVAWDSPVLVALNYLSQIGSGLFTLALIILGLLTILRWMLPDRDPMG